jgi:hypothetical protein
MRGSGSAIQRSCTAGWPRRSVKSPRDFQRKEPGSPLALVQHGELAGTPGAGIPWQRELRRFGHPHRPHPQYTQLTQPDARVRGPAHSGQSGAALTTGT